MTINSAIDHGFVQHTPNRAICKGDIIRLRCALGIYEVEVKGTMWRNVDWCDTVFKKWITPVPAYRQGFVGSIESHSRADLLKAKYAD